MLIFTNIWHLTFQFIEKEERLRQLEFDLADAQGDLQRRKHQLSILHENVSELKVELATLKEQKSAAEKEVSTQLLWYWEMNIQ